MEGGDIVRVRLSGFGDASWLRQLFQDGIAGSGAAWQGVELGYPWWGDRSGPAEARRKLHPEFSLLVIGNQSPPPGGLIFLINIINIFNKSHALCLPHRCGGSSREEEEVGLLSWPKAVSVLGSQVDPVMLFAPSQAVGRTGSALGAEQAPLPGLLCYQHCFTIKSSA